MNISITQTFQINDNSKAKENKRKVFMLKEPIFIWQEITRVCVKFRLIVSKV